MSTIPDNFNDLFQKKTFAQLATIMSDGSPQVSPVWCEYDGNHVVINSAKGRVKDRNMRRNPNVAISIQDPENPYRHLSLKGTVVEITETGADAHIDKLARSTSERMSIRIAVPVRFASFTGSCQRRFSPKSRNG